MSVTKQSPKQLLSSLTYLFTFLPSALLLCECKESPDSNMAIHLFAKCPRITRYEHRHWTGLYEYKRWTDLGWSREASMLEEESQTN